MTVHGLPVEQRERYVNAIELAHLLGVSRSTVKRWTRDGMPSVTWGIRTRRYLPSAAVAWIRSGRSCANLVGPKRCPGALTKPGAEISGDSADLPLRVAAGSPMKGDSQ